MRVKPELQVEGGKRGKRKEEEDYNVMVYYAMYT